MRPPDTEAREAAAWADFVRRLASHLAAQWPAMPDRLGDRYPAFIELAVQQAGEKGLRRAASVARFVNLWFVWGPAYHDKPGFEWAKALLAAGVAASDVGEAPAPPSWHRELTQPDREWQTVHQLVQRSLVELQRLPGARIEPQALASADALVLETFGALGRRGQLHPPEPPPAPRAACDLAAADLRRLDDPVYQQYSLDSAGAAAGWQRSALPPPPVLRIDADHPLPASISLLSVPDGGAPQARLQVRVRAHALCDGDLHPVLGFSGPHGRWVWAGHEAKAASWPVATRAQPLPRSGPGSVIAEETSPELHRLEIEFCGLRDDGDALGTAQAIVSVWPAAQWWLELQRGAPTPQALLPGPRGWARGSTRCRVECDGQARDSQALRQQFEDGLDGATARGLQALAMAWAQAPGLDSPSLEAQLGLLTGQASLTWGWQHGPGGLAEPALMRVLGQLALAACQADLLLSAELRCQGTRTRIALRWAGQAELRQMLRREAQLPPLAELLAGVVARWRFPAALTLEPVAVDSGALLQQAGPLTGALVGEAGLRPCTRGGSGWEWFVGLRLEAVSLPLQLSDPLIGEQRWLQALLPAATLVDWSLG